MKLNRIATFRFYAELNEFLPSVHRKRQIALGVSGHDSVKEIIASAGVPHNRVDLVLVNGNPAELDYVVQPGDFVSVYPVFQSFDISLLRHM